MKIKDGMVEAYFAWKKLQKGSIDDYEIQTAERWMNMIEHDPHTLQDMDGNVLKYLHVADKESRLTIRGLKVMIDVAMAWWQYGDRLKAWYDEVFRKLPRPIEI